MARGQSPGNRSPGSFSDPAHTEHGVQGRRQSLPGRRFPACAERGRKVHLAMDTATSDIRALEFTPSSDGDSPVLPELLDQILED